LLNDETFWCKHESAKKTRKRKKFFWVGYVSSEKNKKNFTGHTVWTSKLRASP
jgi:hypothetical protein